MTTTAAAPPKQRKKCGRKPKDAGGRRNQVARATLNAPERERHEAWLRSQGWPAKPESDIVREALAQLWPAPPAEDVAAAA